MDGPDLSFRELGFHDPCSLDLNPYLITLSVVACDTEDLDDMAETQENEGSVTKVKIKVVDLGEDKKGSGSITLRQFR
jgi:hypothetical protein